MNKQSIKSLLTISMLDFWKRVQSDEITSTLNSFMHWQKKETKHLNQVTENQLLGELCRFLHQQIDYYYKNIILLNEQYTLFSSHIQRASTEEEQWQHQMKFLEQLGYSKKAIYKDKKAKKRWFGNDAIKDRYQNHIAAIENKLCFLMERLGHLVQYFNDQNEKEDTHLLLTSLKLQVSLDPLLLYENDDRVAYEAMRCFRLVFTQSSFENSKNSQLTQHIYRIASDPYKSVWVQTEALDLLFYFDQNSASKLLSYRLTKPNKHADDIFFRARGLKISVNNQDKMSTEYFSSIIDLAISDNSIFVRQQVCDLLVYLPLDLHKSAFHKLTESHNEYQVRAKAWLLLPAILDDFSDNYLQEPGSLNTESRTLIDNYIASYLSVLSTENDALLLRVLLEISVKVYNSISTIKDYNKNSFYIQCQTAITAIHTSHVETRVRRWAAQAREQIWKSKQISMDIDRLMPISAMSLSDIIKIDRPDISEEELGRYLAAINKPGFGFGLDITPKKNKLIVRAGYKLGFRIWRFIHELRNSSTDKRQNYNHTVGRHYYGQLQVPPQKLGESSETKVPGEPVLNEHEQSWRPYIPLLDQILSSLDQGWPTKTIKLYTSEGITEISPPSNIFKRTWAKLYISYNFKRLASLRNWREQDGFPAVTYLQSFIDLGFKFRILPYHEHYQPLPQDSRVTQFFPAIFPIFAINELWRDIHNYFYSVYQNTLGQLSIFLVAISAVFFGQHFWLNQKFRKARSMIPYVIGGWGTRGKSGTERLKSALFNAYGISLISKSTGCEAQFLYAPVNRPLKELFLFRPYDKATIWEQLHLTRLAAKLKVNILLWECMGLTPRYISILQEQWMRDDLSTITNCYPDHEDIQGPSGIDIPKVMMRFVPKNATLITSEDSMSPLLESAAFNNKSKYKQVSWKEGYLIAPEILARFPYEEHPTNIALVLKMAEELGFPADMAVKAMADHVIPDLGVLKVYPDCHIQDRVFTFINGMSANERLAALNNWHRLKLDCLTPDSNPEVWLSTVVNNRADRISRSQVFAKMLVNDLSADMHFLIGSNVDGLLRYIEEQWRLRSDKLFISAKTEQTREDLIEKFTELCAYLRIPTMKTHIHNRILSMLQGLSVEDSHQIAIHWQAADKFQEAISDLSEKQQIQLLTYRNRTVSELQEFDETMALLNHHQKPINNENIKSILWTWYKRRLIIIDDIHISGNELVQTMVDHTPIGMCNKMIGLQNIKGTGLDFIYRWQNWDKTYKLCKKMSSLQINKVESSAKSLSNISDFGVLDNELVLATCQALREQSFAQTELLQAELAVIENNIRTQISKIQQDRTLKPSLGLIDKFIQGIESFLDAGQSVKRRKIAESIYDDLANERISLDRATSELLRINKEQKGGWLIKKLKSRFSNASSN